MQGGHHRRRNHAACELFLNPSRDERKALVCMFFIIPKDVACRFQTSNRSCCSPPEWERSASLSSPVVSGPFYNTAVLLLVFFFFVFFF